MERLVLIDAHALIHRTYHALPKLTSKDGVVVNAVYGFSSILLKALNDLKPDYIAAAFDLPQATFRHAQFTEYKAHRPKMADDLAPQIPLIKDVLTAFRIPILAEPGYEADDIIGTMVEALKKHDHVEIIIVSGDLDLLQLVRDGVKMYTLKRGITETILYDEGAVQERYGFPPALLPEFKALKGDPSDNIPGVKGIGEKTAATLIKQYETLDNLYTHLDDVSPKIKEKLATEKEMAYLSRELSLIRRDAPIIFDLETARVSSLDRAAGIKAFEGFGFYSLVRRMRGGAQNTTPEDKRDISDVPLPEDEEAQGTPLPRAEGAIEDLREELEIAAYLINPGERDYSPEWLAMNEGIPATTSEEDLVRVLLPRYRERIKQYDLMKVFEEIELPLVPVLRRMEKAGIRVDISYLTRLSGEMGEELRNLEAEIHRLAGKQFNVNSPAQVGSVIGPYLEEMARVSTPEGKRLRKPKKTPGGALSTSSDELEKYRSSNVLIDLILKYRETAKLKNTYVDPLRELADENDRVHTRYRQTITATGRLSSQDPNLQNIPQRGDGKTIRRAFITEPAWILVSFDYSQIELRLAAHLSRDPRMIGVFKSNQDIHRVTAAVVFNISPEEVTEDMRRQAKVLNFGIVYGMGPRAFAESSGIDFQEAKKFIEEYFAAYPGLERYLEKIKEEARQAGAVKTLFGRIRVLPDMKSSNAFLRSIAERAAVNFPFQGLNADIIKIAMIQINKELGNREDMRMLLQVHDELVFEMKEESIQELVPLVKKIMEGIITLEVPVVVNVKAGANLADTRELI